MKASSLPGKNSTNSRRSAGRALVFSALSCFVGCGSPVQTPQYACYESPHFHVYYLEREFATSEIAPIASRKERLLDYVNKALDVSFYGVIDTYLLLEPWGRAWASYNGITCESRDYVAEDNGHEIIHIVSFEELGKTKNGFILEGLATAFELDYDNPIERCVSFCTSVRIDCPKYSPSIADQITKNDFDHSSLSYLRAGAFTRFLDDAYGLSKVKMFFRASVTDAGKKLADDFTTIFGMTIQESENLFYQKYFSPSPVEPDTSQKGGSLK